MQKEKILITLDTYRRRFPTNSKIVTMGYNVLVQQGIDMKYRKVVVPTIRKLSQDNNLVIYSFDIETERKLVDNGIKPKQIKDHINKEFYKEIETEAMDFIKSFPSMDKNLNKVLSYNDICLWDFLQYDTWHYFKKQWELIKIIDKLIKKEKPNKICIFDINNDIGKICYILAKKHNIGILNKTSLTSSLSKKLKTSVAPTIFKLTKPWGIGELKLKNNKIKKEAKEKTKFILFGNYLFPLNLLTSWSSKLDKSRIGDYEIVFVHYNSGDVEALKNLKNTVKFKSITSYSNNKIIDIVNKKSAELKGFWNSIKNSNKFKNKITYKGIKVFQLIKDLLQFYFMRDFKEIVKYIELSKNVFLVEKPDINISYSEIGRTSKSVAYSAKKTNTPTLLIQHGTLVDYPLYGEFYSNIFAVYGKNTKKIYTGFGIKSDKIKVIGNIKFDSLYQKRKHYKKERIFELLNIPKSKKIILFTSQGDSKEEDEKLLLAIFNAFKRYPKDNHHLVIKLHPAEDGRLPKNIAKGFDNYTITKDVDIFEMINASDVVITYWSTTGLEAMVLGKPLIVLNLSGKPDNILYAKEGAALGVYNQNKLYQTLKKCFNSKITRQKLFRKQKRFIYNEAYKVDGKVIERLLNIVYGVVTSSND